MAAAFRPVGNRAGEISIPGKPNSRVTTRIHLRRSPEDDRRRHMGFATGKTADDNSSRHIWKFDMHIHSTYSNDSENEPAAIVGSCERTGILPLVCDHNTIAGSQVVSRDLREIMTGFPEVFAEEVMTRQGEIIGLFLTDEIPPYLDAAETIDSIHDQGGLALVPHPFCSFRTTSALWRDTLFEVAEKVDIIEGFNGRNVYDEDSLAAQEFAGRFGIPLSAGSDAHRPSDLGRYWLELEPFTTPKELLRSLSAATVQSPFPAGFRVEW